MRKVGLLIVASAVLIGAAALWVARKSGESPASSGIQTISKTPSADPDSNGSQMSSPVGMSGKSSSVSTGTKDAGTAPNVQAEDSKKTKRADNPNDYGTVQPVRADMNPQVASVAEALKNKTNPERLSPLIPPKPFDPEAYKKDPAAYLSVIEPGRCFQAKSPGKDVPKIQAVSPQLQNVAQGQSVVLRVKAAAGWPVAFSSFDMGRFSNELTSITVEADAAGFAEAHFFGAMGTISEVNILCSSPMTSGQLKFLVNVTK